MARQKLKSILLIAIAASFAGIFLFAYGALHQGPPSPPTIYSESYLSHLESVKPANPIPGTPDPYSYFASHADQLAPPPAGSVCAIKYDDPQKTIYELKDYPSANAALAEDAHVTHTGVCGTCSTLQDLAVYLRRPDLTAPVRRCGMLSSFKPLAMQCLKNLGFTDSCAATWYFNAKHTSQVCFGICMKAWIAGEPSNKPDGSLNSCLACDENLSGPVFKHEAGRTRRNSGIVSSIGRANAEVSKIIHDY